MLLVELYIVLMRRSCERKNGSLTMQGWGL